jgi:hypothetical protein
LLCSPLGEAEWNAGEKYMRKLLGIAAVVAALTVGAAQAGELAFTITGAGHIITFDLPQNPTPDSSSSGEFFTFDSVNGAFDGTPTVYAGATFGTPTRTPGICIWISSRPTSEIFCTRARKAPRPSKLAYSTTF